MATRYYGVPLGGKSAAEVTEDSSTTSAVIELAVVYTTSGMERQDVLNALEALQQRVIQQPWPPA